jgi:hypothetical protein
MANDEDEKDRWLRETDEQHLEKAIRDTPADELLKPRFPF